MLTNMHEIRSSCKETMAMFEWSAVPLGHPLRNHSYVFPAWNISITPHNVEEIRQDSKSEYQKEWADSDESLNHLIATASIRAGISDTNMLLNQKIAEYAAEHVASCKPPRKYVVEIGTGAGGTIISALQKMHAVGIDLSTLDVILVEPSKKQLDFAQTKISETLRDAAAPLPNITVVEGTVDSIARLPTGAIDLVIQNAAIHHESFKDHLSEICRILSPRMPFISGDWHEGTYETPARIYWLYRMLQDPFDEKTSTAILDFVLGQGPPHLSADRVELKEFKAKYALSDEKLASAYGRYTGSERRASVGGMKYWLEIAKIFTEQGEKSPEVVIQCHERVMPRTIALVNAGFVFDRESRAKYHEVIRDRGFGELGAVMVAKKSRNAQRHL